MGMKSDMLAARFETKAREAAAVLDRLSDAEWKLTTAGEKWTVGATAHHLATAFEAVAGIVTGIAAGRDRPGSFTPAMLHELNARQATEYADCAKAETVALLIDHIDEHIGSIRETVSARGR